MNGQIDKLFGGHVRVRACGLCWQDGKLLMVNHRGLSAGSFWAPPGGGVDFGQSIQDTLKHEFRDETGVTIEPGEFRFVGEFIKNPFHAIELYFDVKWVSGEPGVGYDPEMASEAQILIDSRFMDIPEIMALPAHERHGLFDVFGTEKSLKSASGHWKI